jgi:plastocyanin
MRKIYLLVVSALLFITGLNAATVVVQVVNNQFNPSVVNVNVGDIVRFTFSPGNFHNATTNGVPGGLPSGAAPIFSGNVGAVSGNYDYTVSQVGTYKYICEAHADPASFTGMVGQIVASGPMPALLKDFTVTASSEKIPFISWTTLNETNVDRFSIRRSTDGVNFKEVASVRATGTAGNEQAYSYADRSLTEQYKFLYYHIAIIDKDGSERFTAIKMFKNPASITKLVTQIGPNPISKPGQLMVYFNSEKNNFLSVQVFDMSGKMVLDTKMQAFPGVNNGHVHVCDFESGTYTFRFSMDGVLETKKVVVQ